MLPPSIRLRTLRCAQVQDLMDEVAFLKDLLVKKDNFTRQMMNLFHETLNKQCVTGEEEVWEGVSSYLYLFIYLIYLPIYLPTCRPADLPTERTTHYL